jgi:hypothetical protein
LILANNTKKTYKKLFGCTIELPAAQIAKVPDGNTVRGYNFQVV